MIIKDYKIEILQNLLPYLRTNADMVFILKIIGEEFNRLQNAIVYLLDTLTIQNARGIWLDYIGAEVGAERDESDFGNYFCVNNMHLNSPKNFYFLTSELNPITPLSLKDAEFIQKILTYICTNNSGGSQNEIINIIKIITGADTVTLHTDETEGVSINLIGKNLVVTQNTIRYIKNVMPNGVYIKEIKINDKTN